MRVLILSAVVALSAPALQAQDVPAAQWDHREESDEWSRAAIDALEGHGADLVDETPQDVGRWCPGYATAAETDRQAFWVGFLSALAKFESTWSEDAVGGGGKWFGLLQIGPPTAKAYGCRAQSGNALMDGASNLSCAIRIMAETVPRDSAIMGDGREGVAADWAPLRSETKRQDMREWLQGQEYCRLDEVRRPRPRPREMARRGAPD